MTEQAKSLFLNNKEISFDEIKAGKFLGESTFEQSTLTFCRLWLNKQTSFNLQTSGSTGAPKTITVSRQQMLLSARQTINYFNLSPTDRILVCLNTAYIAGILMLVRAFEAKAQIVAVEPSGNPLQNIIGPIDFIALAPMQLEQILNNPASKNLLHKCRAAIVGGAPVSFALQEKIKGTSAAIYATFGMTETLTHFALKQLSPQKEDYFTAFAGVNLAQDERGCLTVTSPVTGQKTLITNDRVEILSANKFNWLGRIDNVINSGGIKHQIEDLERKVEQAFLSLGINNRFFIYAMADEILGEKIMLVVEGDKEISALRHINWPDYFTQFEKPKGITYCKQFVETPTGKIIRAKTVAGH